MFDSALKFIYVITISGIVFEECHAKHRLDPSREIDRSISCYECNSEYDPRCGDPFDPYTIGTVNCSMKPRLEHIEAPPTLCRKNVQKVLGKLRIIRACGYVTDDNDDKECLRRSGTHDIQIKYCSCSHHLCNNGPSVYASISIITSAIITIQLVLRSLV